MKDMEISKFKETRENLELLAKEYKNFKNS